MNPVESLIRNFQDLVAQVPELVQPLIVVLAGAIPFIEGEGAAIIGVVGGINPVAAGIAGALGNFLAVLVVVLLSARARTAVVDHRTARAETSAADAGSTGAGSTDAGSAAAGGTATATLTSTTTGKPESKGRKRFTGWLVRFGVPGASVLGPLAIPTHFTSAMLIATGIPVARVLLWQAVAIALWTTVGTVIIWLAVGAVVGS